MINWKLFGVIKISNIIKLFIKNVRSINYDQVYFNHDGGVDDLVSLFLLLQMENIELVGVSTIGADCYLEPLLSASLKIINRFSDVEINV